VLLYWYTSDGLFSLLGFFLLSILIPITSYFRLIGTNKQQQALLALVAMVVLGVGGIVGVVLNHPIGLSLNSAYVLGFIGYQFLANYWTMNAHSVR
jgi:hypothetical protein